MGFFDRIFGLFGDSSVKAESSAMPASRPRGHAESDAAVATLDAPAGAPATESESPTDHWWAPAGASLLAPVAPVRPELSLEGRMLENVLISHFDGRDLSMPPLPRVPELVLRALRDRNCSFGRVAETIAEDQVLAAAVLRMVNSPLYRGVQRITSLQQAVARLGASAVRQLMLQQSLRAVTFSGKGAARVLAERLWRHALASAWIMHALAEFSGDDADEAFLIGLLHNIGNVIVLRIMHSQDAFSHEAIDLDTFEYLCHESHQEFGELVAEAWNLPT
ncbi:MAG: HDOD domain-containing protein, partial [Phycisphaerae bacterium]|nr:HDOD domain-containing protein [Phycisphaerae bacterium]